MDKVYVIARNKKLLDGAFETSYDAMVWIKRQKGHPTQVAPYSFVFRDDYSNSYLIQELTMRVSKYKIGVNS